jgi:hypothetical protein
VRGTGGGGGERRGNYFYSRQWFQAVALLPPFASPDECDRGRRSALGVLRSVREVYHAHAIGLDSCYNELLHALVFDVG